MNRTEAQKFIELRDALKKAGYEPWTSDDYEDIRVSLGGVDVVAELNGYLNWDVHKDSDKNDWYDEEDDIGVGDILEYIKDTEMEIKESSLRRGRMLRESKRFYRQGRMMKETKAWIDNEEQEVSPWESSEDAKCMKRWVEDLYNLVHYQNRNLNNKQLYFLTDFLAFLMAKQGQESNEMPR